MKTSIILLPLDHAYVAERAALPGMEGKTGAVIECIRDHRTYFELAASQVELLAEAAAARKLTMRDFTHDVLIERAYVLRQKAGDQEPPPLRRFLTPHPEGKLATSVVIPKIEFQYLNERHEVLGALSKAVAECVSDHRTLLEADSASLGFLEQEAESLKLSNRDYIRRVLSDRAYALRLAKGAASAR